MADLQIQALLGEMQKTLMCSICLEMMTNPVSTSCGHQFCRFCLTEFLNRKKQVPCPLCKKPITKRSLTEREQLGEMVQGVRNIIAAFQKDTGAIFSPPRGPQAPVVPGTPDNIKGKSVNKGGNSARRRSNVRVCCTVQSTDFNKESHPAVPTSESVTHYDVSTTNQGKKTGRKTRQVRNKTNTAVTADTNDERRRNELLRCIATGTHVQTGPVGDDMSDSTTTTETVSHIEENSASTSGVESRMSSTSATTVDEKCESQKPAKNKPLLAPEVVIVDSDDANIDNDQSDVEIDLTDQHNDNTRSDSVHLPKGSHDERCIDLSGSIVVDSESSSCQLFKTPKDGKGSKKPTNKEPVVMVKRSLRSRKDTVGHKVDDDVEHDSDISMTQESIEVKGKKVGKTYCKKDKELHVKEKKTTKKVAEWLKNIGEPYVDNKVEKTNDKEEQKVKTSRKTSLKVLKEEEKMGSKMKHLAQQIQDREKTLLFEYDDFDCDKENIGISEQQTDSADDVLIVQDVKQTCDENVTDIGRRDRLTKLDNKLVSKVAEAEIVIVSTDSDNDQGKIEVVSNNVNQDVPKILNKKKIFKSRTKKLELEIHNHEKEISENNDAVIGSNQNKNSIIDGQKENGVQEIIPSEPPIDPYEFKSSQPTPKKPEAKKSKGKKNSKATRVKANNKKTAVVSIIDETEKEGKVEKTWDKNLKPDKTILKTRTDLKAMTAVSAELQQAESFDLITSTQEAAETIDKESRKQKLYNNKTEAEAELTVNKKRVRFTEPMISDFVSCNRIDMIAYRKAKNEFIAKTKHPGESTDGMVQQKITKSDTIAEDKRKDTESKSDIVLDDGDSSGTDDLDIEPTQDEIELPDLDIQSEEMKAQLSQSMKQLGNRDVKTLPAQIPDRKNKLKKDNSMSNINKPHSNIVGITCIAETPQIHLNKDSPLVSVIEETPMLHTVPKFNKNFSKPLKTSKYKRTVGRSPKSSIKIETEAVCDGSPTNTNKQVSQESPLKTGVNGILYPSVELSHQSELLTKGGKSEVSQGELPYHDLKDVTKSGFPESLESTQPPDTEPATIGETCDELEAETDTVVDPDTVFSESLSQRSDLILHTEMSPVKQHTVKSTNDSDNEMIDTESDDVVCVRTENGSEIETAIQATDVMKSDKSLSTGSSGSSKKTKKKRKSFMLEDNEESLDFGSLNDGRLVVPDTVRKHTKEGKRQRTRSGESSSVELEKSPKSTVKSEIKSPKMKARRRDIKETVTITDTAGMGSVDIIADSISYSSVESRNDKNSTHICKSNTPTKDSLNDNVPSYSQASFGASESINEVTVVAETVPDSIECSLGDIEIHGSMKSPKSRSSRRKKMSGEKNASQNSNTQFDKFNSSGILLSPAESFQLSDVDGPIDVDTAMPSLNSSPEDSMLKVGSQSPSVKSPQSSGERKKQPGIATENMPELTTPNKRLSNDADSSPDNTKKRRSGVKSVKGFAKRKSQTPNSQTPKSQTLKSHTVKFPVRLSQSPVSMSSKYMSKKQSKQSSKFVDITDENLGNRYDSDIISSTVTCVTESTHTPVKHITVSNVAKYSPSVHHKDTKIKKVKPEIIEMKSDSMERKEDNDEDSIMLSPDELPDIDDKLMSSIDNKPERFNNETNDELENSDEYSRNNLKNKNMEVDNEEDCYVNDKNTIPETLSPTGNVINNLSSQQSNRGEVHDRQHVEVGNDDDETVKETIDDNCASGKSDTSSDFNLDSSEDESPEKEALNVISNYNKIVNKSLGSETKDKRCKSDIALDEIDKKSSQRKSYKSQVEIDLDKRTFKEVNLNAADMYSSKLDSSPISVDTDNKEELVVLTSSSEDSDNMSRTLKKTKKGSDKPKHRFSDSDVCDSDNDISEKNKTDVVELDRNSNDDDNDDDDDDVTANAVRRKGVKKAILSDSSDDDDDDNSHHMNMTSSSAFSSQSENLNTQEREVLERDLEKMAAEMKAMKEQLMKCKNQTNNKDAATTVKAPRSNKQITDSDADNDSDDENICDIVSDEEEDLFLSQPAYDSLQDEDLPANINQETNPANMETNDDTGINCQQETNVEDTIPDDSLHTVPESQPMGEVHESVGNIGESVDEVVESINEVGETVPQDDMMCEDNIKRERTDRNIGIVVSGLNLSQVQETKKLATMNGCKFFNKFNDSVTHVVVKTTEDDDTMCDRTLKFFQGVANKCWIVNYFWIIDSKEVGHLLPEAPYEIQGDTANNTAHFGPKRSRLSKDKQIFSRFDIALVCDNLYLTKDSMSGLIETCGGRVVDLSELGHSDRRTLVISCADLEEEGEQRNAVKLAKSINQQHGLVMLTREWVLDSLTLYKIQPIQEYVITNIPSEKLPKL